MNEEQLKKHKEESVNKLKRISEKKIKTSMVGALAEFETHFGYMWGHGKPDQEKTKEELEFLSRWELIRNSAFDNAHKQIRGLFSEIDLYDIQFVGYTINLVTRK